MVTTMHTGSDARAVPGEPRPELTSPLRNRYFYGKLLDAYHLELEQCYFLEQSRRINRMGLGFGVLCGLRLELAGDGTKLLLQPGVAIDGLGREIVVPAPVCIDAPVLDTDGATVCLCYHECETEPTRALVSDCEVRERCVNGLVRERFRIHVHPGVPDQPPYSGAAALLTMLTRRLAMLERGLGMRSELAAHHAIDDPTLTELVSCVAPRDDCVVLGTITPPADAADEPELDTFTHRRTIMSNDALFELLLGLTAVVERCCGQEKPTNHTVLVKGDAQEAKKGTALPEDVVVTVTDAAGEPVADATVKFEVTSSRGGSFDPEGADTSADGQASSSWKLGSSGPQTARVTVGEQTVDLTATAK